MVRRRGIVWSYFSDIKIGRYKGGVCKYCNKQFVTNASRMEKHLTTCHRSPMSVKHLFAASISSKGEGNNSHNDSLCFNETPSTSSHILQNLLHCGPEVKLVSFVIQFFLC